MSTAERSLGAFCISESPLCETSGTSITNPDLFIDAIIFQDQHPQDNPLEDSNHSCLDCSPCHCWTFLRAESIQLLVPFLSEVALFSMTSAVYSRFSHGIDRPPQI